MAGFELEYLADFVGIRNSEALYAERGLYHCAQGGQAESDIKQIENRIRLDLSNLGKSDGEIDSYIYRWRLNHCDLQ